MTTYYLVDERTMFTTKPMRKRQAVIFLTLPEAQAYIGATMTKELHWHGPHAGSFPGTKEWHGDLENVSGYGTLKAWGIVFEIEAPLQRTAKSMYSAWRKANRAQKVKGR